jgi:hypothetical protein
MNPEEPEVTVGATIGAMLGHENLCLEYSRTVAEVCCAVIRYPPRSFHSVLMEEVEVTDAILSAYYKGVKLPPEVPRLIMAYTLAKLVPRHLEIGSAERMAANSLDLALRKAIMERATTEFNNVNKEGPQ